MCGDLKKTFQANTPIGDLHTGAGTEANSHLQWMKGVHGSICTQGKVTQGLLAESEMWQG